MSNIFINAYCKVNFGDDLFLKILSERYKDDNIYFFADKKYKKIIKGKNVHIVSRWYQTINIVGKILHKLGKENFIKYMHLKKIISKCNAIVIVGGSLFIESGLTKKRSEIKIKEDSEWLRYKKPIFLLGANFGPYETENFKDKYHNLFSQYKDVCFRDEESYRMFDDIDNVRYANDIAFSYKKDCAENVNNNVIISIMNIKKNKLASKYYDDYVKKISELIDNFIERKFNITLMALCSKEGDNETAKLLLDKNTDSIDYIQYEGNIDECINSIDRSTIVIATRFHSMILGYLLGKKVFTISYSQKTDNVLKKIDDKNNSIKINKIGNWNTEESINNLINSSNTTIEKSIVLDAEKQFKELDRFIKRENGYE